MIYIDRFFILRKQIYCTIRPAKVKMRLSNLKTRRRLDLLAR